MMAQYRRIKSELPKDALLLFRLGDFLRNVFRGRAVWAPSFSVALTKRGTIPMCGIPFHAANSYNWPVAPGGPRLLHLVANCDLPPCPEQPANVRVRRVERDAAHRYRPAFGQRDIEKLGARTARPRKTFRKKSLAETAAAHPSAIRS